MVWSPMSSMCHEGTQVGTGSCLRSWGASASPMRRRSSTEEGLRATAKVLGTVTS